MGVQIDHDRSVPQVTPALPATEAAGASAWLAAGWRATPPRDRLGILYPVVAYRLREPRFRGLARTSLAAPDDDAGLRTAFLRAWGLHGDPNFSAAARKLGLDLSHAERR